MVERNKNIKMEDFIRKCIWVIWNSRLSTEDSKSSQVNTSFHTNQNEILDWEDIFLEDYTSLNLSQKLLTTYILEIYYKQSEKSKILIERYTFEYSNEHIFSYKKLVVFLRTIYLYSRLLPGYLLNSRKHVHGSIEYRLFTNPKNQDTINIVKYKQQKYFFSYQDESNWHVHIWYLSHKEIDVFKPNNTKTLFKRERHKCLSLTHSDKKINDFFFEVCQYSTTDNYKEENILEHYFSNDYIFTWTQDKGNFHDADKKIKMRSVLNENTEIVLTDIGTGTSSYETNNPWEIEFIEPLNNSSLIAESTRNHCSNWYIRKNTEDILNNSITSTNSFQWEIEEDMNKKEIEKKVEKTDEKTGSEPQELVVALDKFKKWKKRIKTSNENYRINIDKLSTIVGKIIH